ncbi:hypothetical protein BZL29_6903 [Mycobacterium kansasii]|uniref:Uncharacterized protein n=1 Tax=Mycobacterium kansasii TaxID=1768 RepID=A0A1V3WN35_MYCKA|nr:hypothetical protein BZL29_6903 [Mycobacterium kansasii]
MAAPGLGRRSRGAPLPPHRNAVGGSRTITGRAVGFETGREDLGPFRSRG